MKKPKKKANKPVKQPDELSEPSLQPAEEAPKATGRFKIPKWLRVWIKESQFLATTLSIILTFMGNLTY